MSETGQSSPPEPGKRGGGRRHPEQAGEDRAAVAALLTGKASAWSDFVRTRGPAMQKAVWYRLRSGGVQGADLMQLSEDGAQEALARLCRDDMALLRRFDPERASLDTWLALLATSAAGDLLRRWRRWARTGTGNSHAGGAVALDQVPEPEAPESGPEEDGGESLAELMPDRLLSPRQKLIMTMLYEKDMDVAEVASALQLEPQTVRSQRHKALEKLREYHRRRQMQAGDDDRKNTDPGRKPAGFPVPGPAARRGQEATQAGGAG